MLLDKIKMEFIGTFFFTYLTGMATINYYIGIFDLLGLMFCYFLIFCGILWVSKHNCEAHLNPVITLVHVLTRRTKLIPGLSFIFI